VKPRPRRGLSLSLIGGALIAVALVNTFVIIGLFSGVFVVGAGIFAFALWMSSNYWKAGRPLGSGESYA
jgi:hypothetical protein